MLPGQACRGRQHTMKHSRLIFLALAFMLFAACTSAAAQTTEFDNDAYIAGIAEQATVTAQLNARADAQLQFNEALRPTVTAFYSGVNEFQFATARMEGIIATFAPTPQPTPVPPTPVVIVQPYDLSQLSEGEMRYVACQLLTVEYVDSWPGFGTATANDIRARLGC